MNAARSWMLATALGSFAAGTAVGLLIPRLGECEAMTSREQEYTSRAIADEELVSKLVANHGLTANQARSLRLIMQNNRDQEDALVRSVPTSELPQATQNRLLQLRHQTTQRIRVVLDPEQRARYDQESRPGPGVGPEHGGPSTATNR